MKVNKHPRLKKEQLKKIISMQDKKYTTISTIVLLLILLPVLYLLSKLGHFTLPNRSNEEMLLYIAIAILVLLILNKPFTYLHELTHKINASIFNHKAEIQMKKSFFSFFGGGRVEFEKGEVFSKKEFIVIVIAPFVLLSTLFLTIYLILTLVIDNNFFVYFTYYLLCYIKVGGCGGDLSMCFQALSKCKPGEDIVYEGNSTYSISKYDESVLYIY